MYIIFQFQSQDQKELMNIYEGQNIIAMSVKELNRKMDEIIGRQEQTLSQIGAVSGGAQRQQTGGAGAVSYGLGRRTSDISSKFVKHYLHLN